MAYYSIEELTRLMEAAARLGVSVELSENDFSLKVDGIWQPAAAAPAPAVFAAPAAPAQEQPAPRAADNGANAIKSPLVGTYYASPAPDKPTFVAVGKAVKKGDVLFIVESMKLMNEVLCERDGTVKEILVENGAAVEYGQPVLVLE